MSTPDQRNSYEAFWKKHAEVVREWDHGFLIKTGAWGTIKLVSLKDEGFNLACQIYAEIS